MFEPCVLKLASGLVESVVVDVVCLFTCMQNTYIHTYIHTGTYIHTYMYTHAFDYGTCTHVRTCKYSREGVRTYSLVVRVFCGYIV